MLVGVASNQKADHCPHTRLLFSWSWTHSTGQESLPVTIASSDAQGHLNCYNSARLANNLALSRKSKAVWGTRAKSAPETRPPRDCGARSILSVSRELDGVQVLCGQASAVHFFVTAFHFTCPARQVRVSCRELWPVMIRETLRG